SRPAGQQAGIEASRPAGRHRGQQASRQASRPAGQQAGIEAHLTKKENNKKLKKSDLDPTPPAQQSWRNLPPVPGDTKERKKARGKPSRQMAGGLTNARARAHTQGENIKHQAFFCQLT
ncbi:hypothetical protein, partial [Thiolapillus sp.]|uniref:hypothetical protein n=1 Tax=Thiolapillus sp. TaxID=2017437 RepID=UPI003AF78903